MKQNKTNRLRETNNALAREALLYGIQCEREGDFAKAEIWYTKASREGSQEGHSRLQRIINRRVPNAITEADAREYQRNLNKANEVDEKDKVSPSLRIPKEDERILVEVISTAQTSKEQKKKQSSQLERGDQQTSDTTDADSLYQRGREAEKKGKVKAAHNLYKESAKNGHRGAQQALGKLYLKKALELLGGAQIDIDNLMALILNQEKDSDGGADAAPKERKKREAVSSHQPTTNKHHREVEDRHLSPTVVLPNQTPEVPEPAEETEQPRYRVWVYMQGTDAEASIKVVSIPEAPTDTKGSGEPLSGWKMEGSEETPEDAEEPLPEPKCAQTESSGSVIAETEEKRIDLSPREQLAGTGCFFCRLLDKLSAIFSQLLKH